MFCTTHMASQRGCETKNAFITTEVKQNKKAASNRISQEKRLYGLLKNVAAFICFMFVLIVLILVDLVRNF